MMRTAAGWLLWNLCFIGIGAVFAGSYFALAKLAQWAFSPYSIEVQVLAVHVSGLLALAITLFAGYASHRWINRRKP